uniref:Uncharacterized protein n=1 Tax=Alexandrium catenella TaxID=2925 RepID=A0A7S1SEB7_ALECA
MAAAVVARRACPSAVPTAFAPEMPRRVFIQAEAEEKPAQTYLSPHRGDEAPPTTTPRCKRHTSFASITTSGSFTEMGMSSEDEQESTEGRESSESTEILEPSLDNVELLPGQGLLRRIERSYNFHELCELEDL